MVVNNDYVYKWKKPDGRLLTRKEYKEMHYSAQIRGMDLEDYMRSQGIVGNLSYGELQNPRNNSAKLVSWFKIVDGEIKMLTNWKYLEYQKDAGERGLSTGDYLRELGFKPYREYRGEGRNDEPTRWIDIITGEILFRKEYTKLFKKAQKRGTGMEDYLKALGFRKLLDSKREGL